MRIAYRNQPLYITSEVEVRYAYTLPPPPPQTVWNYTAASVVVVENSLAGILK